MSLEEHHRFILNCMERQTDIARKLIEELERKNAALAAENERLRKAGDAMQYGIHRLLEEFPDRYAVSRKAVEDWLAAKEGSDAK